MGAGLRVKDSGLRAWSLAFGGLGMLRVQGLGFRVQGSGFRVKGLRFRA